MAKKTKKIRSRKKVKKKTVKTSRKKKVNNKKNLSKKFSRSELKIFREKLIEKKLEILMV